MERFNYNHLFYFWTVARRGSIRSASAALGVSQPTISEQLRHFEKTLGQKVFQRSGRNLRLTEAGSVVFDYASRMFAIGNELHDALSGDVAPNRVRLAVGVSSCLPQGLVVRVLTQAFQRQRDLRISCLTDGEEALFAMMGSGSLDLVLSRNPAPGRRVSGLISHDLSANGVSFLASPALLRRKEAFPAVLNELPFLMPGSESSLHAGVEKWLATHKVRPKILGSISDHALSIGLAERGVSAIVVPSILEREIRAQHPLALIGRAKDVVCGMYATAPRKNKNSPVDKILQVSS